ncbi:CRISPR-associated helicase Cas3' [Streptomyces sp. NPDC050287]|uniref:CRISPR-associated helicase Cas3' n=1 Tax=Streptomyces sp. NPDC050287 TaxID=3365608 RepID=UPI0037B38DD7
MTSTQDDHCSSVRAPWGKAGGGSVPHPLICHALDTAAVAESLVDVLVGPHCREELERAFAPLGEPRRWIAVLCGLHDLGKYSPTFQALREDIASVAMDSAAAADMRRLAQWRYRGTRTDCHHGVLTAVHWQRILRSWGAAPATARIVAWALGGHHGVIPLAASVRQARSAVGDHGGDRWAAGCEALVRRTLQLWGLPKPDELPWHEVRLSPEAVVALAGLTSVSDWIASSRPVSTYAGVDVDLDTYVKGVRKAEAERVGRLQWTAWQPPQDTSFRALFPEESEPHPVQEAVETVTSRMQGPGIIVVSAPTGEGKTKAALQAAAALVRSLGLSGFYVAMPSRVTSNQAFDVAAQLLERLDSTSRIRLLHSAAADYLRSRGGPLQEPAEPLRPQGVDVDGPGDGDGEAREWFTHKRGLLAPLGVGTVDQVLMAALRSSHVFVRLVGLSGKAVVFDEVHGYDVHMSMLMDRLLWWLGKLGVPVVLLSATLPERRQQELVQSWEAGALGRRPDAAPSVSCAPGYPRVTWADASGSGPAEIVVEPSQLNQGRTVQLERIQFDDHADWALKQAGQGRCVAVVHNVVRHAVSAHEQILRQVKDLPQDERPEVFLLHGRLAQAERVRVEAEIRTKFGRPHSEGLSERPTRAIVVGTQLLEQGLDADFDVMVSALAPVDSMIQRMGRIQRHQRGPDRPPLLLALTGVEERRAKVVFPPYTTRVYAEAVLLRTWALLRTRTHVRCPDEVQELVDAVYGDDDALACPDGWHKQWVDAAEQLAKGIARHEEGAWAVRLPQPRDDVQLWELTARATSARQTREQNYQRDDDRG